MLPSGTIDWAQVDVAVPRPADRPPGISMAGFSQRVPALSDITMVAHPSITMILDLSMDGGIVHEAGGWRVRGSFVAGLLPGRLRAGGRKGECLQIRLSPVAARAILGGPSSELSGTAVSFHDVWGRGAEEIEDRLRAVPTWDGRFALATELLARRATGRALVDPEVAHVWGRTFGSRGRVRVERLAGEVGWSRKRLWSRFGSQLGITPKRAARLVRFDHAAHLLASGTAAADAASESGFVDQAHLHREVKAFTGLTPAAIATAPWLAIDDTAWPTA